MLSHENSFGQGKARRYAEMSSEASGLYGAAASRRTERASTAPPESGERKSRIFGVFKSIRSGTRKDIGRAVNE